MTSNPSTVLPFKYGKLAATRRFGLQDLSVYANGALPAPPSRVHYGGRVTIPWGMDGNGPDPAITCLGPNFQGVGDCVPTGFAHTDLLSNYEEGGKITQPVQYGNSVIEAYCTILGCTVAQLAANPNLDVGCNVESALEVWRSGKIYGAAIDVYSPVKVAVREMQQGLAITGCLGIGIQCPQSAQNQFPNEWTYVSGSPIEGGHYIILTGYDQDSWYGVTWGRLIQISYPFLAHYCDEAWVVITDQAKLHGIGPNGINVASIKADLPALAA